MADPLVTPTTTATVLAAAGAAPVLSLLGVNLGLQADVLIAGLVGAIAAIVLLDSVPGNTDTLPELLRTTFRRITVAAVSSACAGYGAPVLGPVFVGTLGALVPALAQKPQPVTLLAALVIGGGAQQLLKLAIRLTARGGARAAKGA